MQLFNHLDRIIMRPVLRGADKFYVAEGEWDLLGSEKGGPLRPPQGIFKWLRGLI